MLYILISALIIIVLDSIYLNLIGAHFKRQVKAVQGSPLELNFVGAAACYVFIIFGLNYFILKNKKSVKDAFLLGLVIYAVFELTNLALFKNWYMFSVIIDTLWGGILFALTTGIVYRLQRIALF
jgi:uncharacterized membrane protein